MRVTLTSLCSVYLIVASSRARAETPLSANVDDKNEENAIGVRDLSPLRRDGAVGPRQSWMFADAQWDAFQGTDHHPIDEEMFFRIVGRDDLVRRYDHKSAVKKTLTYGGGALLVGGLVFAGTVASLNTNNNQNLYVGGSSPSSSVMSPVWGLAIAGAGLIAILVGHNLDPTPIDADQAGALARGYDRSLRPNSGISETASRE
jgi:hypothetical protein